MTDVVTPLAVAWPPPIPPNTRANNTPQLDTHPGDHNQISDALTALLTRAVLNSGFAFNASAINIPASLVDLVSVTLAPVAALSRVLITGTVFITGTASTNYTITISDGSNNALYSTGTLNHAANGTLFVPVIHGIDLAAGANPSFKIRAVVTAGGGTQTGLARASYVQVAR